MKIKILYQLPLIVLKGILEEGKNLFKNLNQLSQISNIVMISDYYDVKNVIENNIKDNQSRFLLIISTSSTSQFLIGEILEDLQKKYVFFLGSHFEDNLKNEYYSESIINKI